MSTMAGRFLKFIMLLLVIQLPQLLFPYSNFAFAKDATNEIITWMDTHRIFPSGDSTSPDERDFFKIIKQFGGKAYFYMSKLPKNLRQDPNLTKAALIDLLEHWVGSYLRWPNHDAIDPLEKALASLVEDLGGRKTALKQLRKHLQQKFKDTILNLQSLPSEPLDTIVKKYQHLVFIPSPPSETQSKEYYKNLESWIKRNRKLPDDNIKKANLQGRSDYGGSSTYRIDSFKEWYENLIHYQQMEALGGEEKIAGIIKQHIPSSRRATNNILAPQNPEIIEPKKPGKIEAKYILREPPAADIIHSPVRSNRTPSDKMRLLLSWIRENKRWPNITSDDLQEKKIGNNLSRLGGKQAVYEYLSNSSSPEMILTLFYLNPDKAFEQWYSVYKTAPSLSSSDRIVQELAQVFQDMLKKNSPSSPVNTIHGASPPISKAASAKILNDFIAHEKRWPHLDSTNPTEKKLAEWVSDQGGHSEVIKFITASYKQFPAIQLYFSPKVFFDSWFSVNSHSPRITARDFWERELARYAAQNPTCDPRIYSRFRGRH